MKCIELMFPAMHALEVAKLQIENTQSKVATELLDFYLEQFSSYAGGAAKFNNEAFLKVEKELMRRDILRQTRGSSSSSAAAAIDEGEGSGNDGSCIIM